MLRYNPPLYFLISLVLSVAAHYIWPMARLIDWPFRWLGALMIVSGGGITVWAESVFKRVKTTVKPHGQPSTLVDQGPFRVSRHPIYLGMCAVTIGVAVLLGSMTSLLGPILFWVIMQFVFIPYEEHKMAATFGDSYRGYLERTRMWI